jgi:hypothetical protein
MSPGKSRYKYSAFPLLNTDGVAQLMLVHSLHLLMNLQE